MLYVMLFFALYFYFSCDAPQRGALLLFNRFDTKFCGSTEDVLLVILWAGLMVLIVHT